MDDAPNQDEKKPKSMLLVNIIVSAILGFVSGGLGFALFTFLPGISDSSSAQEATAKDLPPGFVSFGEVVVNLADGRMSRYLRLDLTLQVDGGTAEKATADVESKRAILRNWLLGYLSDLQLDDIKGAAGQNRIRREVQNFFNDTLSPDGVDVVHDVLFVEFTIQ